MDWHGVIECVRSGEGRAELEQMLRPGLRLLINRRTSLQNHDHLIAIAVDVAVAAIRAGSANTAQDVAHAARAALNAAIEGRPSSRARRDGESASAAWMRGLTGRDFDALQRLYGGRESVPQICARLSMSLEDLDALHRRARAKAAAVRAGAL